MKLDRLADPERQDLRALATARAPRGELTAPHLHELGTAAGHLPARILDWARDVREVGCGVLSGLPVDPALPPTPLERQAGCAPSKFSDTVVALIGALFGEVYTFEGKRTPAFVHDVFPVPGDEEVQLGSGSVPLEWHVEDGLHPARPDWVVLYCLRCNPRVATHLTRAKDLLVLDDHRAWLRVPVQLRVDDSFAEPYSNEVVAVPTLSGDRTDPDIVFDPAFTVDNRSWVKGFLVAVSEAADRAAISVSLSAGDVLVFNNRKWIHARSGYRPRLDGSDRWLKRAVVISDPLWRRRLTDGVMPFYVGLPGTDEGGE